MSIIIQRGAQEPAAGHVRLKVFQAAAPLEPWSSRVKKDSCLCPVPAQTADAAHVQMMCTNMYYLKQRNFQETFFAGSVLR
jgi:hypothetical protein